LLTQIYVGQFRLTNVPTLCVDDSHVPFQSPAFALGSVALSQTSVTFDARARTVVFAHGYDDISRSIRPPTSQIWTIDWLRGAPVIRARIAGHPALLLVDTGSTFSMVSRRFADKYLPKANGPVAHVSAQVASAVTTPTIEVPVCIGVNQIDSMVVPIAGWPAQTDGSLGAAFLAHGRFTLDYPHGKALYEPYN